MSALHGCVPGPQFTVYCNGCIFLGRHAHGEANFDLYFCRRLGCPAVIVRSGELPSEVASLYFASYEDAIGKNEPLAEAMRRAVERCLLTPAEMQALGVV